MLQMKEVSLFKNNLKNLKRRFWVDFQYFNEVAVLVV